MAGGELIVVFDLLPEFAKALEAGIEKIVKQSATDLKDLYQDTAPVDSGFMASSAYVVTHDTSTYGQGVGEAPHGASLLPEVEKPSSPTEAIVAIGASYAIYPEMGTVHMPAQPTLGPAGEVIRVEFEAALIKLADTLAL